MKIILRLESNSQFTIGSVLLLSLRTRTHLALDKRSQRLAQCRMLLGGIPKLFQ